MGCAACDRFLSFQEPSLFSTHSTHEQKKVLIITEVFRPLDHLVSCLGRHNYGAPILSYPISYL